MDPDPVPTSLSFSYTELLNFLELYNLDWLSPGSDWTSPWASSGEEL